MPWNSTLFDASGLVKDARLGFGGIQFVQNATQDYDHGIVTTLPDGFGDAEFTLKVVITPSQVSTLGTTVQNTQGARENWATETAEPGDSTDWWYLGNFLLDGHNNSNFGNGTFSLQVYNSGRVRWTFGDGDGGWPTGGLWGIQNSSGINILDGGRHVIHCVRRWQSSPANSADLELWVDGSLQATVNSGSRTNMATSYWDSWTGFPASQDGWFWGAEKQAALTINGVNDYADYKGLLEEVTFYNGALSSGQISADQGLVNTNLTEYLDHWNFSERVGNPQSSVNTITMTLANSQPSGFWPNPLINSLQFSSQAALSNAFDSRAEVPLPADGVGINFAGDVTIEMWIAPSATPADNSDSPVTEGSGYDVAGNIILDRDIAFQSTGHILGISSGVFYFTCDTVTAQATRVGTTDLRDGNWHHVAVCRNATNGLIELFVDGDREDTATGPTGSLAHPDDLTHSTACGPSSDQDCVNSDPYLVLGCEKHELQLNGYIGLLTCLRISNNIRYSGATYTVPIGPFSNDANTLGLYQMKEGSGSTIADESGNNQTMVLVPDTNGTPQWSSSSPFV